jgi:hypothetical protein
MTETELTKDIPAFILRCPVYCQWLKYKGETYFGMLNYERSIDANRPMIDLSYCATRAFNGIVMNTVAYDKKKFKESRFGKS